MKRLLVIQALLLISCISLLGQPPGDNPLKSFYGKGHYPIWTDSIQWNNVINMATYEKGANDFEKFENARDSLYHQGGGVLYYPAGTYDFTDMPAHGKDGRGLMLKSGVIIRGEKPTGDYIARDDGQLNLGTIFQFPTQTKSDTGKVPEDWSFIGIQPPSNGNLRDVKNVGLVWVKVKYGTVFFGFDAEWGSSYQNADAWKSDVILPDWQDRTPDGTFPFDYFCGAPMGGQFKGAGSGRLVFGCNFFNSVVTNNVYFNGLKDGHEGYFMFKFGARISIYASHIFVANNTLPKPTAGFKYDQITNSGSQKTILFDYGNIFGFDINKNYLNIFSNKTEGYLQENVIIKDNFVWNHGRNGFALAGKFMTIKNNKNDRAYLYEGDDIYGIGGDWELTLDGYKESEPGGSGSVSDNLSRAFDMAGQYGWIDSNAYNSTGSNPGNDGEGILWQAHGGMGAVESFSITHNDGISGYMAGYDVEQYGALWAWNTTSTIGNKKAGGMYDVSIVDNAATINTTTEYSVLKTCPDITPNPPDSVRAQLSTNKLYVTIRWADNSTNEIGYRIDKSIGDTTHWETICYRPRKANTNPTPGNQHQLVWRDYNPARGLNNYYRVVAINCHDNDKGASQASDPVQINSISTHTASGFQDKPSVHVYPNPADENIYINNLQPHDKLALLSMSRQMVHFKEISGSGKACLTVNQFPAGFYVLTIQRQQNTIARKKILVIHE